MDLSLGIKLENFPPAEKFDEEGEEGKEAGTDK
jgi:hypothetical protein